MAVQIREVTTKSDYRKFIKLPAIIHKGHKTWLPNMYSDDMEFFDKKRNPNFEGCETFLALAWKDEIPVGRIMGIISHRHNEKEGKNEGHFFALETYDDPETHHALIEYAENWVRSKGCTRIIGPYGFSDKDPQGFLVEGFDLQPMIVSACNFPYQVTLLENEGYTKEIDCVSLLYKVGTPIPPVYVKVMERYGDREGLEILEFTTKKELKKYIVPFFTLMNETFEELYGFVPMTEKEMYAFANRYMQIIDPRFLKVIKFKGEMTAFMFGIPTLSEGIQRSKGKMFPFGFYHILRAAKKTKSVDLMLGGVKERFRGMGFEVPMTLKLLQSLQVAGFEKMEIHLILETNRLNLAQMARAGCVPHKRFRVFKKELVQGNSI